MRLASDYQCLRPFPCQLNCLLLVPVDKTVSYYNCGEFGLGIEEVMHCLREGNAFFQAVEPWKLAKQRGAVSRLHSGRAWMCMYM